MCGVRLGVLQKRSQGAKQFPDGMRFSFEDVFAAVTLDIYFFPDSTRKDREKGASQRPQKSLYLLKRR
jgi:hypothetical protein